MPSSETQTQVMDLRGVPCPLNWARAKVRLEGMARGAVLEILVDDPRSPRDLPIAAESAGYAVIAVRHEGQATKIIVER